MGPKLEGAMWPKRLGRFFACFYDGSKYSYLYSDGINWEERGKN